MHEEDEFVECPKKKFMHFTMSDGFVFKFDKALIGKLLQALYDGDEIVIDWAKAAYLDDCSFCPRGRCRPEFDDETPVSVKLPDGREIEVHKGLVTMIESACDSHVRSICFRQVSEEDVRNRNVGEIVQSYVDGRDAIASFFKKVEE
jgi:hypothetical protein